MSTWGALVIEGVSQHDLGVSKGQHGQEGVK